ncbi:MAG: ABC transporter permease [Actinobacteria bacterium]|nr:ABC transporter permease [Actinomycetota bacterium]
MQPLSNLTYFARNKRKAIPMLAIIALAVFGVSIIAVIADTMMDDGRRDWINPTKVYARVFAAEDYIDPRIGVALRSSPDVERVMPALQAGIRVQGLLGSRDSPVIGLKDDDMRWYMERAGIKLVEGRLPGRSRDEIALHAAVLKSKGIALGDYVGKKVDKDEWLPGKYLVVGRLQGPIQVGLTSANTLRKFVYSNQNPLGDTGYYVFSPPGRMEELDKYLRSLSRDKVIVRTLTTATRDFKKETGNVDTVLWIINGVTITVLSLAMGLLNTIYFMQRISEYGILLAMGYRVGFLIRRTLMEAVSLTMFGWALGVLLSDAINWVLRQYIFAPRGITLAALNAKAILFTVPIPVMIGIFSLSTVLTQLLRLDPVTIVERRE